MTTSFRQSLEKILASYLDAIADGSLCVHDYLHLIADGCESVQAVVEAIGDNDAAFEQLVTDCQGLVLQYVVPIDLGKYKIPKFVEQFVIDPQLPQLVRPLLEAMRPKPHPQA